MLAQVSDVLRQCLGLALIVAWLSATVDAQKRLSSTDSSVRLLIDCVGLPCDQDFFRTEISFVDHVRERQDADVHILITSEPNAGGGLELTFTLFGQGRFAGRDQVLRQAVQAAESADSVRRETVRMISLGLVPYALESPAHDQLTVGLRSTGVVPTPLADPWRRWTFRTQVNGNGNHEQSTGSSSVGASVGANRTTEAMKLNLAMSGAYTEDRYDLPDGSRFLSPTRSFAATGLLVGSMGSHWSAGLSGSLSSSTFRNLDRTWYLAPAVEYDLFPYSESTRRILTIQYSAGVREFDYAAETIFGKLEERSAAHSLVAALTLRQRWGTVGSGIEGASFIPDTNLNHATAWANVDLSLARGFALNVSAEVSSVHDRVSLPRGGASAEEILVRRRQLATDYSFFYSFGVSYTFGSIYSPVVNPRLGRSGF